MDYARKQLQRDGYLIVRGMLGSARTRGLLEACDHVLERVRTASGAAGHSSTHVTGLLSPEHFVGRPELLARLCVLASAPDIVALLGALERPLPDELRLRTLEYFHEPSERDYDGPWHRDGGESALDADGGASSPRLRVRIPFCPDDHLELVPGSHARGDTPAESEARWGLQRTAALTGALRLRLAPGDVCVFDTWTVHRGRYRSGFRRRTLDLIYGGLRPSARFELVRRLALAARRGG